MSLKAVDRPRLPVIMLGEHALALIRDIFDRQDLFRDLPRIERRVVAWGVGSTPRTLEHSAVAVSEEQLLNGLRPFEIDQAADIDAAADFTIFASRPLPPAAVEHRFGSRMATAVPVQLSRGDSSTCCIESLEHGWLFLIPNAPASGWVLAVGDAFESLLASSRVIAQEISEASSPGGEFPCFPRIAAPLCGPNWLGCGTAAMAFDPICGDGTAHAVREAILASAVVRGIAKDSGAHDLFAHYEARLTAGFARHLQNCRTFYASGGNASWWTAELQAIEEGIEWCRAKLRAHTNFRYQLRGFELEPVR